ncbi:DUF6685 family protein [Acinetobacter sp. P1(2025)]|uniref:DUF6685 family protein n=1 Tax=Acinetobacter sp. P1(2025) TaxID=3446120 RepID=UPI003F533390
MITCLKNAVEAVRNHFIGSQKLEEQKMKLQLENKILSLLESPEPNPIEVAFNDSVWKHARVAVDSLAISPKAINGFFNQFSCGDMYNDVENIFDLFSTVFFKKTIAEQVVDLRSIDGLSASKSMDIPFKTLDEFAEKICKPFFDVSEQEFKRNWNWEDCRILREPMIEIYGWSHRMYLLNSSGSHHFTSARYIAHKLGKNVQIKSPITLIAIDPKQLFALTNQYQICLLRESDWQSISSEILLSSSAVVVYDSYVLATLDSVERQRVLIYRKSDVFLHERLKLNKVFLDVNNLLWDCYALQKKNCNFQKTLNV